MGTLNYVIVRLFLKMVHAKVNLNNCHFDINSNCLFNLKMPLSAVNKASGYNIGKRVIIEKIA